MSSVCWEWIVGLSETRRPGSEEISSRGFINYWSGRRNGARIKGVAIGVSSRLHPSVVEVIPVDERIMRLRLKHTLGFMSLVAVYAPTGVCGLTRKMFYAKLDSVLDQSCLRRLQCCHWHWENWLCIRNTNCSFILSFAKLRRLRIAGSWYQRPELHRWTWYSNPGGVAKEIDHILVSTRWRIL